MFKNPLKYQQGGKTQDAIGQLVKWLVQNTGLDENQISQRLNQILSDDTAKQELVNNLQNMQKGDQNAAQNIIGMFVPQSAKFGGKIHDFICKHAKGGALKGCGCKQEGGNVEKHQDANGKIGVTNGKYQASDWENEFNQFTPTPGGGYARNYRLPIFGGHRWGIPGNTLRQVLITYGDNGIPRKAVRDLEGYYGNGQIDTVIYDAYGNRHNSPEFEARVNRELEGMDPHQRLTKKEIGGKVEKVQNGEKTNDTPHNGTISQGKPRSKVSQAIDNNSKARNFVKGAKQFVKSPMVKWPLAGALAYGGYRLGLTPTVQSMGDELAPHMAPYLFPFLSQMRPKFILDTMNPMKESPKVEKPGDVFWVANNKSGGKIEKAQDGSVLDFYKNKWKNDFFD